MAQFESLENHAETIENEVTLVAEQVEETTDTLEPEEGEEDADVDEDSDEDSEEDSEEDSDEDDEEAATEAEESEVEEA